MVDPNPPNPQSPATNQPGKFPDFNFKEIVTAAIALAIVTTLIVFLWNAFFSPPKEPLGETQKYVIGIILSLAGTVTGYYFGRVPAEKHADTAQRAADDAKKGQAQADAKVEDVKKTLDRVLPGPMGPGPVPLEGMARDAMPSDPAQQELMALRRRM